MITASLSDDAGPTPADLTAIEQEWPLIAAEMDVVAAEITLLCSDRPLTELDWRRLRRAEALVMRELTKLHDRPASTPARTRPASSVARPVLAVVRAA